MCSACVKHDVYCVRAVVLFLAACDGNIQKAKTHDAESEMYTKENITADIETINLVRTSGKEWVHVAYGN